MIMPNFGFLETVIRNRCMDSGHVCPQWVNNTVLEDLEFLDETDNGTRAKEYFDMCHSVECVFRPAYAGKEAECFIRCRSNNLMGSEYDKCDYTNEEVAQAILQELLTPVS